MKIQILGTGCSKCKQLEENAIAAVKESGVQAEVVKVSNLDDIMNMGVMITPALAIDDDVKVAGRVLSKDDIIAILKG